MNTKIVKSALRRVYVPLIEKVKFYILQKRCPIKIMTSVQTIKYIRKKKCSISRYGDGEFALMFSPRHLGFQNYSPELAERLRRTIIEADDRVLLCFPSPIVSTWGMKPRSGAYWRSWCISSGMRETIFYFLKDHGAHMRFYGDAMITRPYMDWKSRRNTKRNFRLLKSLWENEDILIVEGDQSRLGVGNDLFSNSRSIKRILAPSENAFEVYDTILNTVLKLHQTETVLIALGPTATVLAGDLSKYNIQALDIGHIDIEYEWYRKKTREKERVTGKYTNEAFGIHMDSNCDNPEYQSQIVARIR